MDLFTVLQDFKAMGIEVATGVMFVILFLLLLTGMPLAFVTLLVALIFALGWFGPMAVPLITSRIFSFVNSFVFVSVPMFVLMAAILDRSGIARDLFDAMRVVGGRLRGGVAIQTLLVAVVLAAMSGIIGGEVVLLGLLALPQMLRLGYDRRLAIGVCCAGGALGTMVPPSIVLIIYGLTASVSIGDLFTASFMPGLMLASFYIIYVLVRAYMNPEVAPIPEPDETTTAEKLRLLKGLILPIMVVIFVLGSIYGGIASVTEASAIGVIGVTLSTMIRGEFTFELMIGAAKRTLATVGMIVWIGIGRGIQSDGWDHLRVQPDHRCVRQSDRDRAVHDGDPFRAGHVPRLGGDRAADDADLRADHSRSGPRSGVVRCRLCDEHAGQLPVAALRPGRLLFEVGHAARYLAW